MNRWKDIYPELVNKFRWSIQTAFGDEKERFGYVLSQHLATVLAQDALEVIKAGQSHPEILYSTHTMRAQLQLGPLDKATVLD